MDVFGEDYFSDDFEPSPVSKENAPIQPPLKAAPEPVAPKLPTVVVEVIPEDRPLSAPDGERNCIAINCLGGRLYLPERDIKLTAPPIMSVLTKPFAVLEIEARESSDRLHAKKLQAEEAPPELRHLGSGIAWVDKYAPKHFIDLISPDDSNRKVLLWLNQWRKKIAAAPDTPDPADFKQILLIGGSPGVGKSVLVNCCVHQQGFNLLETNASEARTREDILKQIQGVCQNQSVIDADKPRVLLFEEIDGADRFALDALVESLKGSILRPIICICNDLWSRALKPLRDQALVLVVDPPRGNRLQQRVKEICKNENVQIESLAISKLLEVCELDIRSTLNHLQALAAVGQGKISSGDVLKGLQGLLRGDGAIKDSERNEAELLEKIFLPKRLRSEMHAYDISSNVIPHAKSIASFPELLAHTLTCVPFTDSNFNTCAKVCDLLATNDLIHGDLTLPILSASASCAAVGHLRLDLPEARKVIRGRYQSKTEKASVIRSLTTTALTYGKSFHTVVAPLLLFCLGIPSCVNWARDPTKKHDELEKLVRVMVNTNFSVTLKENEAESFELNPNLEIVTCDFQNWQGKAEAMKDFQPFWRGIPQVTEIVAQKIQQYKFVSGNLVAQLPMEARLKGTPAKKRTSLGGAGPAKRPKTEQHINMVEWCGAKLPEASPDRKERAQRKLEALEFRFQEGHSTAVKRVVLVSEFLCN